MASFRGEPIKTERSSSECAKDRGNRRLAYRKICSMLLFGQIGSIGRVGTEDHIQTAGWEDALYIEPLTII